MLVITGGKVVLVGQRKKGLGGRHKVIRARKIEFETFAIKNEAPSVSHITVETIESESRWDPMGPKLDHGKSGVPFRLFLFARRDVECLFNF